MSTRLGGAGSSIERWRAGLTGPELNEPGRTSEPAALRPDGTCPTCERPLTEQTRDESYDEDFDYYWGDFRMPLWIALILQVPWRQRLDIFVIGLIVGLSVAGIALLWGVLLAQY